MGTFSAARDVDLLVREQLRVFVVSLRFGEAQRLTKDIPRNLFVQTERN